MSAIDVRTKTMSAVALACRASGHWPNEVAIAPRLRAEHHAKGQRLTRIECARRVNGEGCGRWRELITDMDSGELIGQRGSYTDADLYLVQETGTGRLSRAAARVAYYARVGERKDYRRAPKTARSRR